MRLTLGTAGHIDHGKTALVRALTGVDTDRLPQEKARGITIELGFAPLDLGGGRVLSVVDVPGHEKLVRTMVGGATGIDLLLLVVAADEGVMPQTREHVAICDLLGIDRGVVALTKADLVDPEVLALAEEETRALLEPTGLARAPVVPVSAETGAGLEALREALRAAAAGAPARTPRTGPPRLPVDRVFAMKGFGTVVTGTLTGGALATGDAVVLHPSGLRARVRGLQRFGEPVERAEPGARCAVNLQGVEVAQVTRGEVLAPPEALVATHSLDAALAWLPGAPGLDEPVAVEFLVGTSERRGRLAPIGPVGCAIAPGAGGFARIHLEGGPLALLPGDRFVVRGFARSPGAGATLGGGRVLDASPPHRRLSDPGLRRDLALLAAGGAREALAVRIRREGLAGVAGERLARETGLVAAEREAALDALVAAGEACATPSGRWLSGEALTALEARLARALEAWHAAEPLRPGLPLAALRGRLPANVAPDAADLALARCARAGRIVLEDDLARTPDHRVALAAGEGPIVDRILAEARAAALEPPALREWAERLALPAERLSDLLAHLEREGRLVRARGDLWFDADAVAALRARVRAHFARHRELDTPTYKSLIGTPRRTAVPLMELLDAERLTQRTGDVRILRPRPPS